MILETIVKPIAYLAYQKVLRRERQLGYKIQLNQDTNKWINGTLIFDMTPVWRKHGLDAIGVNYCTIGKVIKGLSSRFDSSSLYYQSWLGGYIVRFSQSHKWTIDDHFRLGEADQINWLKNYGIKSPTVDIIFNTITDHGKISLDGYSGKLYQGIIRSNTDVGNKINKLYSTALWTGGTYFFKQSNPDLAINYSVFIPKWKESERLYPYQVIDLEGFIAILNIDSKTKAIFYINGCNLIDKFGKKVDTFQKLKTEFLETIKKFTIIKIT